MKFKLSNVLLILLIIVTLFGMYCFIHFAYQASKYNNTEQTTSYTDTD